MTTEEKIHVFVSYCQTLYPDFHVFEGNCLDVSVGFALALQGTETPCDLVLLLRDDDVDPEQRILSHAVVAIDEHRVDGQGDHADTRWVRDFNRIQKMNGDTEVDFEEEWYSSKLRTVYSTCLDRFNMNNPSRILLEKTYHHMLNALAPSVEKRPINVK